MHNLADHRFENGAYETESLPPVGLQTYHRILQVNFMLCNLSLSVVYIGLGIVLWFYLLSARVRVVKVIKNFCRLKVLILIINYGLKSSVLTNRVEFIRYALKVRPKVSK